MRSITTAFKTVFSIRSYKMTGAASFVFFLLLYAFTLPAKYSGGQIGLVSLQHLSWTMGLLALALYQNAKYIARSPACRIPKEV